MIDLEKRNLSKSCFLWQYVVDGIINVSWYRVDGMINISLYRVYEKRNCCLNDE